MHVAQSTRPAEEGEDLSSMRISHPHPNGEPAMSALLLLRMLPEGAVHLWVLR